MEETTLTFRVEVELKRAFLESSKAKDSTGSQVLRAFMREYIAKNGQFSLNLSST